MTEWREVGLVAGRGNYPLLLARAAKDAGVDKLVVVALRGETEKAIEELADHVEWLAVGQLEKTIKCFLRHEVGHLIFAGQIRPSRLFTGFRPDLRAIKTMAKLKAKNADTIFSALGSEFEKDGLNILPATTFMEEHLAALGPMGRRQPGKACLADVEFGRCIAREVSRLDIGQTVVVKDGTVLAVEAFEGTDKAVLRGGELGKGDVTVVKVAKPEQDMRFDVPCVGELTVETLRQAGARALAVEAGRVLFLDKQAVVAAFDKAKIAVVGIELGPDVG